MTGEDRLLLSKAGEALTLPGKPSSVPSGLPLSLLRQSSQRLRIVSLVLFMVTLFGWVGSNFLEGELVQELQRPMDYVAPVVMLIASGVVYIVARRAWLSPSGIINAGLAYEVIISFCIPISTYWGTFYGLSGERLTADLVGLSGVAVWMLFFTVLVPSKPRSALIALTLSGAAVPITIAAFIKIGNAPPVPPLNFAFIFVLPYATVVLIAYIAARVIYGLGREVRRAQEMGSYELLSLIGRGGMGEVWRARHQMLARPAAIKLIRRDALGADASSLETALARFEREAHVTAGLQSPHTVGLYDFGVSDEGSLYYVMELLDGIDLESLVRRYGPLPAERAVHILRQVCLSLGEAHRRDLIHRDIKPANIYLCERAFEPDYVKVLDFGLAKHSSTYAARDEISVTDTATVPGTPAYLAPETVLGKPVDGRADLYALGCVAFWLLTGRRVFEEETAVATILAHTSATPDFPSACSEMPIPASLDALVLACLAKDPADRPDTAEELARNLDAIELDAPWTADRAAAWWETHRPTDS